MKLYFFQSIVTIHRKYKLIFLFSYFLAEFLFDEHLQIHLIICY